MATETKYELEFYTYLDALRRSGATNMWGAAPYLIEEFDMNDTPGGEQKAGLIVADWMDTFTARREAGETGD
jgi:hypothetical protein